MYADTVTQSMQATINETERRRSIQIAYNKAHGIVPKTVTKGVRDIIEIGSKDDGRKSRKGKGKDAPRKLNASEREKMIAELTREMKSAADQTHPGRKGKRGMSKRRVITEKAEQTKVGKRRLRLIDPFALGLWSVILLLSAFLAVLSAIKGFNTHWYGDVLTVLDWIVGILALINLMGTFSTGVRVTDGIADLGRGTDGARNTFCVALLRDITVSDSEGTRLPETDRRWRNASLKFHMTVGIKKGS